MEEYIVNIDKRMVSTIEKIDSNKKESILKIKANTDELKK